MYTFLGYLSSSIELRKVYTFIWGAYELSILRLSKGFDHGVDPVMQGGLRQDKGVAVDKKSLFLSRKTPVSLNWGVCIRRDPSVRATSAYGDDHHDSLYTPFEGLYRAQLPQFPTRNPPEELAACYLPFCGVLRLGLSSSRAWLAFRGLWELGLGCSPLYYQPPQEGL